MPPVYVVTVDPVTRTVRPLDAQGDDYFGLGIGTNGTAATNRRQLAVISASVPADYRWVRANGSAATGLNCVPTARSESAPNPWTGEVT